MANYAGLGNADEVFRYAEISREQQDSSLILARAGPGWDGFRADPRYFKLLTEIGLSDGRFKRINTGNRTFTVNSPVSHSPWPS
jgi:hypothetical protein